MERTLHRDLYMEASWFDRERRDIFFREWTCVARTEELPDAGSFRAITLLGENLLLVRGIDGVLRGFYNVCRHRGCQLIDSEDAGQAQGQFRKHIRCPYHSWTYRLDGGLQNTPHIDVDKSAYSLHGIAAAEWGGFVFVRLDDGDKTLPQQLGPVPERVRRYPLDDLRCGWRRDYVVAANWKVILENYNECYHCAGVHPELCSLVPAFRARGGQELDWEGGIPQREGTNTFTMTGRTNRPPFPGLNDVEKERHFGELVYPNLMLSLSMDHAAAFLLWPIGAEQTMVDCRLLFHPDALAAADFDPADAGDFWHTVNEQDWRICERVQRGMHARPFEHGHYAPMEDMSLDIREYVVARLGPDAAVR
jgi:Rieske 2Fe-2S family protein